MGSPLFLFPTLIAQSLDRDIEGGTQKVQNIQGTREGMKNEQSTKQKNQPQHTKPIVSLGYTTLKRHIQFFFPMFNPKNKGVNGGKMLIIPLYAAPHHAFLDPFLFSYASPMCLWAWH